MMKRQWHLQKPDIASETPSSLRMLPLQYEASFSKVEPIPQVPMTFLVRCGTASALALLLVNRR